MVDRGYNLNRGKGQTKHQPPRSFCQCGKKGLGPWKYAPGTNTHYRECRYCHHVEVRP